MSIRIRSINSFVTATFIILAIGSTAVSAEAYYFHTDHLGTPQALTDANQQVVWQGEYSPFGEVTESVNAVIQNLRFPGQYFDAETELHYNYFRTYDDLLGRYTQSDPIGLLAGPATYTYVNNKPTIFVDPLGLIFDPIKRHIQSHAAKGNWNEVRNTIDLLVDLSKKDLKDVVTQCANKRKGQLIKKFKEEGVGTGARSGQHGTPHKKAGAELVREANGLPAGPLKDALKTAGQQAIKKGNSLNH